MSSITASHTPAGELTKGHKKVIFASSLGTVFEWYDFYLYGSLAAIIANGLVLDQGRLNPRVSWYAGALAAVFIVRRFRSAKQAVAYAGLAPGWRESAGKRKDLSIEKKGSRLLRWVLVEAAWQVVRYNPRWKEVFESLARRTGKKKAITAVARRLLSVMVALLKSGRPYDQSLPAA